MMSYDCDDAYDDAVPAQKERAEEAGCGWAYITITMKTA